jgi:hypothetical protein
MKKKGSLRASDEDLAGSLYSSGKAHQRHPRAAGSMRSPSPLLKVALSLGVYVSKRR